MFTGPGSDLKWGVRNLRFRHRTFPPRSTKSLQRLFRDSQRSGGSFAKPPAKPLRERPESHTTGTTLFAMKSIRIIPKPYTFWLGKSTYFHLKKKQAPALHFRPPNHPRWRLGGGPCCSEARRWHTESPAAKDELGQDTERQGMVELRGCKLMANTTWKVNKYWFQSQSR